jgi:stringent starvation protein B
MSARLLTVAGLLLTGCKQRSVAPPQGACLQPEPSPAAIRNSPSLLRAEQKRQRMAALLGDGKSALLLLDARVPGVDVPKEHRRNNNLTLEYGLGATIYKPIVDLAICPEGVHGTLSFKSVNHTTFVPWGAVFAMSSKAGTDGTTWQEDIPADLSPTAANE